MELRKIDEVGQGDTVQVPDRLAEQDIFLEQSGRCLA